jgi:hypothetical protein
MFKSIHKLLFVAGIILLQTQSYSAEREKGDRAGHSSSKPKVSRQSDLNAMMDAADEAHEEKKKSFSEIFLPRHLDILLNAPIIEIPGGDGQQIKTERQYLEDLGLYVSLVFRHRDILNSIRAIVQKDFAEFIEKGGDTASSEAETLYKAALRVAESGRKISTYSRIVADFHSLVDSGTAKSETATLATEAGNPSLSDRATYKIMVGTKGLLYSQKISGHAQWIPASLIATSTYSIATEEKEKPADSSSSSAAAKPLSSGPKASKPTEKKK